MPALNRIIRDTHFAKQPRHELGDLGNQISQLHRWSLATPKSILLPRMWFDQILVQSGQLAKVHNRLASIRQLPAERRRSEIHKLIEAVPMPQATIAALKEEYQTYLHASTVQVSPAQASLGQAILQVTGDVSLIITVQKVWAEMINQALSQTVIAPKDLLAPAPVLIQQEPTTQLRGSIYNRHPDAAHKAAFVVEVIKNSQHALAPAPQVFQVDRRTLTIISRPRSAPVVDQHVFKRIVIEAEKAFRQSFQAVRLDWMLDGQTIYWSHFSNDSIVAQPTQQVARQKHVTNTKAVTKLWLAVTNLHRGAAALPQADGVGMLDSSYYINAVGIHPMAALHQSAARTAIAANLVKALETLTAPSISSSPKPIVYQLYNSPTTERRKLKLALNYETPSQEQESSQSVLPFYLQHPDWLEFELSTLAQVFSRHPAPYAIMLPNIASPKQLAGALSLVRKSAVFSQYHPEIWLELAVPAVACNISLFDLDHIHTVSVNYSQLLQRMLNQPTGVLSDQHELAKPTGQRLMDIIEKQLAQLTTAERPQLVLHSPVPDASLVRRVVTKGWQGITTTPASLHTTRSMVIEAERLLVVGR